MNTISQTSTFLEEDFYIGHNYIELNKGVHVVHIRFLKDRERERHTIPEIFNSKYRNIQIKHIGTIVHCADGPAIVDALYGKDWVVNGLRHRIGGPACVRHSGSSEGWFENGQRHRTDGPARTEAGASEWWVRGKKLDAVSLFQPHDIDPNDFKNWTDAEHMLARLILSS